MFFPPFFFLLFFGFIFLLFFLFALIKLGLLTLAFARLGIAPDYLFSILFLCIVGSMINIPIRRIRLESDPDPLDMVSYFGLRFRPPRWRESRTMILAVNVGGAVIPTLISLYLLANSEAPLRILVATAIVTWLVHKMARPVPGVGIATPMLVPPILAALAAMLLTPHWPPPTAYVAGTLGTLIGADIMNLDRIKELNAPVVSIGGAGTFDGIFLTGILAVLLA